jgi:hypothetical protein
MWFLALSSLGVAPDTLREMYGKRAMVPERLAERYGFAAALHSSRRIAKSQPHRKKEMESSSNS